MELARFVAFNARLDVPDKAGVTARPHLIAERRNALNNFGPDSIEYLLAARELEGPTYPHAVHYLHTWLEEVYGTSGESMNGLNRVSYTTLRDWAFLRGVRLRWSEVVALRWFDSIRRNPPHEGDI